ncbi:hypothetical protein EYF80_013877 [Liparis tanakae]|uniref:Uncharacterized protein n=1 Tax=Liparis tanakae TaxID=230148 RepID=A0A4Z2IDB8_9TELE|nr:hypothetical protein EYF80_013877 [Liparis tanakae]
MCLRQGTEFLMQVPVSMSTLSTMTNGFSSRVTMDSRSLKSSDNGHAGSAPPSGEEGMISVEKAAEIQANERGTDTFLRSQGGGVMWATGGRSLGEVKVDER